MMKLHTLTTVFLIWVISTIIMPITPPAKRDAQVVMTAEVTHRFARHLLCKAQSLQGLQKPMVKKCQSSTGFLMRVGECNKSAMKIEHVLGRINRLSFYRGKQKITWGIHTHLLIMALGTWISCPSPTSPWPLPQPCSSLLSLQSSRRLHTAHWGMQR